jgi:hypothetical protein
MKISFRATSILVVLVSLYVLLPQSLFMRRPVPSVVSEDGSVTFDVCGMWEQIGWIYGLAALVWIFTFLILILQGLRNRLVSRTTALVSLAAFGTTFYHQLWRVQHCYSLFGIASFCFWTLAVALMCLYHVLRRPVLG